MNGYRWNGPANYFADGYLTTFGNLRIPFSYPDSFSQIVCLEFEVVMGLSGDTSHTAVFRLSGTPPTVHQERFDNLLSCNKKWIRRDFIMAEMNIFENKKHNEE